MPDQMLPPLVRLEDSAFKLQKKETHKSGSGIGEALLAEVTKAEESKRPDETKR